MTNARYIPGVAELGRKNEAGGYVGIDGSGDVIGTFAQRRDTAANIAAIVLKDGELAFAEDTQETFIGDGTTSGGLFLHQQLQSKAKTWSGLTNASIATGEATEENSLLLPKLAEAVYEVYFDISIVGETSNTSNFQMKFSAQGLFGTLPRSFFRLRTKFAWYSTAGEFIQAALLPSITTFYIFTLPSTHLTLPGGNLLIGPFYVTPGFEVMHPFTLQAACRVGSSSAATVFALAYYRRVQ